MSSDNIVMSEELEVQGTNLETIDYKLKINRHKDKPKLQKIFKIKKQTSPNKQTFVPFNDPLYQYLDNEVMNKEQHNFGPWIQSQKKLTREKIRRQKNDIMHEPRQHYFERTELNDILYEEQQLDLFVFPTIIERNRMPSLQQIKHSSIQFRFQSNPGNSTFRINRDSHSYRKSQFFNKMQGLMLHKFRNQMQISDKKSTFNYNYCVVQQNENEIPLKNKLAMIKQNKFRGQSYLKFSSEACNKLSSLQNKINEIQMCGKNKNQMLVLQLKKHRSNKLK